MKTLKTIIRFSLSVMLMLSGAVSPARAEETPDPTPVPTATAETSADTPAATPAETPAAATAEPEKDSQPAESAVPEMYPKAAAADAQTLAGRGYAADEEKSAEFGYAVYSDGTSYYFYGQRSAEDAEPAWYIYQESAWVSIRNQDTAAAQSDGDVTVDGFTVSAAGILKSYDGTATAVTIPAVIGGIPVTQIGADAFAYKSLTEVTISEGIQVIGARAFFSNPNLTKAVLPATLQKIEEMGFADTGLADITLPQKLAYLGGGAFYATQIADLLIPKSVTVLNVKQDISPEEYILPYAGVYEVYAASAAYKYCIKYGLPYRLNGQSEVHRPDIKTVEFENSEFSIFSDADPVTLNVYVNPVYLPLGRNPIAYTSSDTSVCTVAAAKNTDEAAIVTPVSAGTCKITASVRNNFTAVKTVSSTAEVRIVNPVKSISIQDVPVLQEGDQVPLQITYDPAIGIDKNLSWTTDSTSTGGGYVDEDNILHVYKAGTLKLTATPVSQHGSDNVSASTTITVEPKVTKMVFNDDPGTYADVMLSKGTLNLSVTATTRGGSTTDGNSHIVWKTDPEDTDVAAVSGSGTVNGAITLKHAGSTIIRASADGVELSYVLNVYSVDPDAQVAVNAGEGYSAAGMKPGTSFPIALQAAGADVRADFVEYKSSDESVASVDNGEVTVHKEGTAVITAIVKNDPKGRAASLTVKGTSKITAVRITAPAGLNKDYITGGTAENLSGLKIPYSDLPAAGNTIALGYTLWNGADPSAANTKVTWKSNDASVASVDAKGLVTIKKFGEVTITATAADSNKASSSMSLQIVSTRPVLTTTSYTLNKRYLKGEPVDIYDAYGETIDTVIVMEGGEVSSNFTVNGTAAEGFRLNYTEQGRTNDSLKKNAVYPLRLVFGNTANGDSYFCDVKVKIADADPVIKVSSYTGMVNPFFVSNTMKLNLSVQADEVESIRLENPGDLMFTAGFTGITADGTVTVAGPFPADSKGQYHTKGSVVVKLKDYSNEVKVAVNMPLKYIKPHFLCLPINNTGSGRTATSVSDQIYGTKGAASTFYGVIFGSSGTYGRTAMVSDYSDLSKITVKTAAGSGEFKITAMKAFTGQIANYTITSSDSGSADITLSSSNWTDSVTFRYTVKYLSAAPALRLVSYETGKTVTGFTLNKQLLSKDGTVVYEGASIRPAAGTRIANGFQQGSFYSGSSGSGFNQISGDKTEGAKISLSYYYGSTSTYPSLSAQISYSSQNIKPGTYGYTYDLKDKDGNRITTLKFTVKIVSSKPVLSARITGTVNPIDRTFSASDTWYAKDKYAKPTETTAGYNIYGIAASQQFDYVGIITSNGSYNSYNVIFPAANAPLEDGRSYPVTLIYYRETGGSEDKVSIPASVKVKQVLPKLTVGSTDLKMYNRFSTNRQIGTVAFVTSQVNAVVDRMEITDAALASAFRISWTKTADNSYTVTVFVKDSSLIKAGSVSTLPIRIHYKNEAVNTKTFSELKIKITDRSSLIRPEVSSN